MNILQNDNVIRRNLIDVNAIDEDWTPPMRLLACYVINTDSSDGSGQHWVSFFIDTDCSADYWDSYGTPPLQPISSWLLRQSWNGMELSLFNDDTCPSGHISRPAHFWIFSAIHLSSSIMW